MLLSNFNLNLLFIFTTIYRTKSITTAAKELSLTQPGVSQHLKGLEDILEIKLFDRINRKLIPTNAAQKLFSDCQQIFHGLEMSLINLKEGDINLIGTINIGIPHEFGNNCVLPEVSKFCKKYPGVKFNIVYGLASLMNELLMRGELDFAFVDKYVLNPSIKIKTVFKETLALYASQKYMKNRPDFKENINHFEKLDYISYFEGEAIIRSWFDLHYKKRNIKLNVKANAMDVQGISKLILNDLGVGILPEHHISKLGPSQKSLVKIAGKKGKLLNTISIAYLKGRSFSAVVKMARDEITTGLTQGLM